MQRIGPVLLLALASSACVAPSGGNRPDPAHRNGTDRARAAEPDTKQCLADLQKLRSRFTILPNQDFGGGCSQRGNIMLTAASVPITNVRAVKCGVARNLTLWIQGPVQRAAREGLGSSVIRLETFGGYACRNVIGNAAAAGQRSEHATGNAIDIAAFVLADGRRITVEKGWRGGKDERDFLRNVRASACKQFPTVLSPDYNAAHYNHFHFDMGRGPFCR
jgi:hypothetical protein